MSKTESKFKKILTYYQKIIDDFAEEETGKFKLIFPFCDEEIEIDRRNYYKILAINIFFEFFNCLDLKDISFEDFYELVKFDLKNEFYLIELLIDDNEKTQKEKKEIILKYLEYYKENKSILKLINELNLI